MLKPYTIIIIAFSAMTLDCIIDGIHKSILNHQYDRLQEIEIRLKNTYFSSVENAYNSNKRWKYYE